MPQKRNRGEMEIDPIGDADFDWDEEIALERLPLKKRRTVQSAPATPATGFTPSTNYTMPSTPQTSFTSRRFRRPPIVNLANKEGCQNLNAYQTFMKNELLPEFRRQKALDKNLKYKTFFKNYSKKYILWLQSTNTVNPEMK